MKIEGVIICVDYSDFLSETLSSNRSLFDKLVVVTSLTDQKTKTLCDFYNVECVQTDVFYKGAAPINKGLGINEGLKKLDKDGWVIHLDADIYLPTLTRNILEMIELDPNKIYGVDRMMCPTYEAWRQFKENPKLTHEGWIYIHPTIFPMGVRVAAYMDHGYFPIGFFQLWHPSTSKVIFYPEGEVAADRSDVVHCKQWSRGQRELIPEIIAIHLDSEDLDLKEMGKNWNGRKTKLFKLPTQGYKKSLIQKIKDYFTK